MASVLMLTILIVSLILALITPIRLKVKSSWKLIPICIHACFLTQSKVLKQSRLAQEVCGRKIIERNLIVIAELRGIWFRGRQDIADWILK